MSTVKITFLDKEEQKHKLFFQIYDSDLANRWIDLIHMNQERNKTLVSKFTNRTYEKIHEVRQELKDCVKRINKSYDKKLPVYSNVKELDTDILNELHEEFEIYGDRIDDLTIKNPVKWWTRELHGEFLKLNELIHLHEDVLKSKDVKFSNMALLFDYYPQEIHSPILERDKLHLKADLQWGKIYLGYNTLGKDWLKVYVDNDIDVVLRDQVRPQNRFAAETWINFGPDGSRHWHYIQFEKWYLSQTEEVQAKIPINNLTELCLGRFLIGEIIITEELLAFEPNEAKWRLPSSETKLKWNKEVFSTFEKVINVEII